MAEVSLPDGHNHVLHVPELAPHLGRLALALDVVGVHAAWIFHFNDGLSAILVLDEEVRHVPPLVLLTVDPWDGDAMPLHPFGHMGIAFQTFHHPWLHVALVLLQVPGTL